MLSQVVISRKSSQKVSGRMGSLIPMTEHPGTSSALLSLRVLLAVRLTIAHVPYTPWGACAANSIQGCSCLASGYSILLQELSLIPSLPESRDTQTWPTTKLSQMLVLHSGFFCLFALFSSRLMLGKKC